MTGVDAAAARHAAQGFPGLKGMDLARVVSVKRPYQWTEGSLWRTPAGPGRPVTRLHVVAYDYGVKRNILRLLVDRGCRVTVLPAQTPAEEALSLKPDGIFLSNGPGDPEPCDYAISAIRRIPIVRHSQIVTKKNLLGFVSNFIHKIIPHTHSRVTTIRDPDSQCPSLEWCKKAFRV